MKIGTAHDFVEPFIWFNHFQSNENLISTSCIAGSGWMKRVCNPNVILHAAWFLYGSMSFGDMPVSARSCGFTIPLHICQKKRGIKTAGHSSASSPPWISTSSPVSFVPFQLSKPAEMKGAEGAARCASTANGKCQSLSRTRNNK